MSDHIKINGHLILLITLALALSFFAFTVGCPSFDDKDVEDDTVLDDDDAEDDDDDDDTADDDDDKGSPPEIFSGSVDTTESTFDPSNIFIELLVDFDVCDPDNDLSGGKIIYLIPGTDDEGLGSEPWDNLPQGAPKNVGNCNQPTSVKSKVSGNIPNADVEDFCFDLRVTDGRDNLSNVRPNICVDIADITIDDDDDDDTADDDDDDATDDDDNDDATDDDDDDDTT